MTDEIDFERPKTTKVGYGNPPEKSRFKKGQSGNRRGRPRGSLNMATVLERTLREKVVINENGKRKTVTKLEGAIKQVANQAASGEPRAIQLLTTLVRSAEERGFRAAGRGELIGGETNIDLATVNIDETTGRRIAETYLARHGGRRETGSTE
jgi:hypothetical protein